MGRCQPRLLPNCRRTAAIATRPRSSVMPCGSTTASASVRDVEELLAERGVTVTYETIRAWCAKFGPTYAAGLRRRRARVSDKWHLDEVQLKIKGKRHWCGGQWMSTVSSSTS